MGRWEWLGHVIRMNQEWWRRNVLKVKEKVEEKWEGPD
jgi:hypothetical protein